MTATISEGEFGDRTQQHRRELHVHCYRMLASYDEADDAVQETMLKAWRARDSFAGDTTFRAWLYRIATNVCLDAIRRRKRKLTTLHDFSEVPWLQPYPDRLLDEVAAPDDEGPDARVVDRETISLTFLAALQLLPARQRAALIARDVLGWPAAETAALLETSVAATNSALQRARVTLGEHLPERRAEWTSRTPTPEELDLLSKFIRATEECDFELAVSVSAKDMRITMPPNPMCFDGLEAIAPLMSQAMGPNRIGDWKLLPTSANGMPTAASYLREVGDTEFRAFKFDVIRVAGGVIAEVTTFGVSMFPAFGLPELYPG